MAIFDWYRCCSSSNLWILFGPMHCSPSPPYFKTTSNKRMVDRCGLVVVYVCRCEGWCRFMQDYVGVYVCSIYVCMFVLFVCLSICMYPHISAHVRTYDLYICHARVCMHLCMYMYVYVCLCNTYRSARGYVLQSSYQVFSEF